MYGIPFVGASDEARTRYLHLGKVALYQMSYTRNDRCYYSTTRHKVNPYFKIYWKIFKPPPGPKFRPSSPGGRGADS